MTRKVPVLTVEDYVKKITVSWRKSVSEILETARLCADANKHLQPKERKELQERLPFGQAAFSMYVKVGLIPGSTIKAFRLACPRATRRCTRLLSGRSSGVRPRLRLAHSTQA